jgi:hypothetical protein
LNETSKNLSNQILQPSMKIESTYLSPKLKTFLGYLMLSSISFFALKTLIHIFTSANPLELKSYDWWPNIFLYSVTLSFGVTFGARRVQLTITNPTDIERVNDMVENFFTMNGTRVKKKYESETIFESVKSFNRLFNNWFETELVCINKTENQVKVVGPFRLVDSLDSKLRFTRPLA